MTELKDQHIIGLEASNVKRLTAVKITLDPEGRVVILTGDNGAGKSSVLDAIEMALRGEGAAPQMPIRQGQESGRVILTTENLVVKRRFTAVGSYLEVTNREGWKVPSGAQGLLNALAHAIGFDPQAFGRSDPKEQGKTLLALFPVPLDLVANAAAAKNRYECRREANADVKRLEAQLAAIPEDPEAPPELISSAELVQEIETLTKRGRERNTVLIEQARIEHEVVRIDNRMVMLVQEMDRLKDECRAAGISLENLAAKLAGLTDPATEIEAVKEQLGEVEGKNARVRAARSRKELVVSLQAAKEAAAGYDKALAELASERTTALASAKFPVEGLSLDAQGAATLNGIPLNQCATSEQIRVGIAMAAAANPKLKVAFIRDGSLLDAKSMQAVAELAKTHNMQVWIERVDDKSAGAILIEDGSNIGAKEGLEEDRPKVPQEQVVASTEGTTAPQTIYAPAPPEHIDAKPPDENAVPAKRGRGRPRKAPPQGKPLNLFGF